MQAANEECTKILYYHFKTRFTDHEICIESFGLYEIEITVHIYMMVIAKEIKIVNNYVQVSLNNADSTCTRACMTSRVRHRAILEASSS